MTFGITAVLSLLYVLLGLFTDQILVLRLTERVVRSVIAEALARLSTAVDQAGRRLTGDPHADPIAASRAIAPADLYASLTA